MIHTRADTMDPKSHSSSSYFEFKRRSQSPTSISSKSHPSFPWTKSRTKRGKKKKLFKIANVSDKPTKARHSVRIMDATSSEFQSLKMRQFEMQHQMIHDLNSNLHSLMMKNGSLQEEIDEAWEEVARLNGLLMQRDAEILKKDAHIKMLMNAQQADNEWILSYGSANEDVLRRKLQRQSQEMNELRKAAMLKDQQTKNLMALVAMKQGRIEQLQNQAKRI